MSELSRGPELMEKIVSLCKRRGFVYPSSEIYGGFAAVYDYGSLGVELVNNIKEAWWKAMVRRRDDIVGLDSAIFTSPRVWEASGHVGGFSDPLAECKSCHSRLRVDHLLEDIGVVADEKMSEDDINALFSDHMKEIKCPKCGKSDFSPAKKFNLLVKSNLGNFTGDWEKEPVYLRGETCQGIYVNFSNVLNASRKRIPFGIAQIGKAFRNEITARQFVFRTREFEQMEMQYFTKPDQEMVEYEKLRAIRWQYYLDLGLKEENLKWHKHENLVFYAKEAYDIEYNFPFGFKELEGIHARGNYDLTQHSKFSGQELLYTDPVTNEKYLPHIIESSVGVGRTMLAVITDAYHEEEVDGEVRVVLRFPYKLAPVKVAILPLSKKDELSVPAKEVAQMLREADLAVEYDETQSIGKRYRRQDEIGTPLCVTFDFDSLEDKAVTIRDRDTMEQVRVPISELAAEIKKRLS
jgi:glycyl-tRNA synthetase